MAEQGRIALVTGGNRGIGFEIVRGLAAHGMRVLLASRDLAKGEAAARELGSENVSALALDVADETSVQQAAEGVRAQFGRLDVLVNNAAVYFDEGVSFFDVSPEDFRTTIDTNLMGAVHTCRHFMPMMREARYGRVVNVSSGYGKWEEMQARVASYKLSKLALNGLTRILADEARGWGDVKVNVLDPGWVATDMGGREAPRTPAQGADTAIWLATLPANGPTGGFFYNRQPTEW